MIQPATSLIKLRKEAFHEALSRLEERTLDPVIPGESRNWLGSVLSETGGAWKAIERRCGDHECLIQGILNEDPELATRARTLQAEEFDLRSKVQCEIDTLQELERSLKERDETHTSEEPVQEVSETRRELLSDLFRFRALDKEVEAWYLEACYRDRGVQD
jgi:hypothetical protein